MKLKTLFEDSIFTPEQFEWCKKHIYIFKEENFYKDKDGLSTNASLDVFGDTDYIPFKIYNVKGVFSLGAIHGKQEPKFKDMTYFPIESAGSVYIACKTLHSFNGSSGKLKIAHTLTFDHNRITSLKGIGDAFKSIDGDWIEIPACVDSSILGLMKFNAQPRVLTVGSDTAKNKQGLIDACKIIKKHHSQGQSGIVKAQREMIEADLDDFAEF